MNIEAYSYTVVTTVLGMLVVFLSLTALSLLMVVLKASFRERAGELDAELHELLELGAAFLDQQLGGGDIDRRAGPFRPGSQVQSAFADRRGARGRRPLSRSKSLL